MKIIALRSSNSEFLALMKDVSSIVPVHTLESPDSIFLSLDDCDGVLLDLDTDQKVVDKLIKKIRKNDPELPVFVLCNSLDPKKLAKHQKSKFAPDLYFRYPTDIEVIQVMLSEFFEPGGGEDFLSDTEANILKNHEDGNDMSPAASKVSKRLDDAMEDAFPDEFLDLGDDEEEASTPTEVSNEASEPEEFSLGDDDGEEFSLGDDDGEELSLGDDDAGEEFSLGDDEGEELSLGDDSDDLLSLDDDGSVEEVSMGDEDMLSLDDASDESEGAELSLAEDDEEELETQLPSNEDLEFPDIGGDSDDEADLSLSAEGEEAPASEDMSEAGALDLGGDELSLGAFDLSAVEGKTEEEAPVEEEAPQEELELGTGLDLATGDDDSQMMDLSVAEEPEAPVEDDMGLDLGSSDAVDESFDPFAMDDETPEEAPVEAKEEEPAADTSADEGFTVEVDTMGETQLNDLFATDASDMEIEHKEPPAEETLERIKAAEVDSYMDPEEEMTKTSVFVDSDDLAAQAAAVQQEEAEVEVEEIEARELPDSPPDFTTTIQRKMEEIDALVDDEEDEATVVTTIPQELSREEEEEETRVHQMPVAEEIEEEPTETHVYNAEELIDEIESEEEETVQVQSRISNPVVDQDTKQEYRDYVQNRDEELMRLGETIKSLRADREGLLERINEYEDKENQEKKDFLSLQAELDEKKIEIEILKKRYHKELDDLKFRLDLTADKKEVLAAKNKQYEAEFEKMRREKNVDVSRVRARERELEEKLELLKRDSEVQIRNRDQKILELKRRIDTLEFDIENAHMRERKKSSDQEILEERMDKVIKTLRNVIGQLEDDSVGDRHKLIKKNLDV